MLTDTQLKEIKELQSECEELDSIQLKLNWDMLSSGGDEHLLHYEDGVLAAFLGIYGFGSKAELCGMVKPSFRRRGHFTRMLNQALAHCKDTYREILLNAPAESRAAKELLKKMPCTYSISEYQMQWAGTPLEEDNLVSLRPSEPDDLNLETELDVLCFGLLEHEAYDRALKRETNQDFIIIEYKGKSVGKLRVSHSSGEAWIYGFAVLPDYQGKGIGRDTLKKIVLKETGAGFPVFLEVEAKNEHALRLYESCGFKAFHVQDYYQVQF
ncbi:GNAT family N-acetyltransferase [Metabacillus indicus]|uniref:GNAT family N-acetyltransferase n=1 Tax=Metabacillus indicus TaxID=246786 RepID=UPI003175217E